MVSFICLKAFAFDDRNERKDAHDILYCLEFGPGQLKGAGEKFQAALKGKHAKAVERALNVLKRRFVGDKHVEGYKRDGCVSVAQFEIEGDDAELKEARILRQRQVNATVAEFLKQVGN